MFNTGFSSLDLKQVGLHFFSKTATATITTFCEHALRCAVQFEKTSTESSPSEGPSFFQSFLSLPTTHVHSLFLLFIIIVIIIISPAIPATPATAQAMATPALERLMSYYDRVFSLTALLYPQTFCVKHQACCEHYSYICKKVVCMFIIGRLFIHSRVCVCQAGNLVKAREGYKRSIQAIKSGQLGLEETLCSLGSFASLAIVSFEEIRGLGKKTTSASTATSSSLNDTIRKDSCSNVYRLFALDNEWFFSTPFRQVLINSRSPAILPRPWNCPPTFTSASRTSLLQSSPSTSRPVW